MHNSFRSRRVPTRCVLSCGFYPLLVLLIFTTSCHGQVNTDLPEDRGNKVVTFSSGQPITAGQNDSLSYGPLDFIQCAYQDKAGNLWFGTGVGVFQYDGKKWTRFTVNDGLCHNEIGAISEDRTGKIYFGTNDGISCYDGTTFTNLPNPGEELKNADRLFQSPNPVSSILLDKAGNLWFGTLNQGVYRYDGTNFTNFLPFEVVNCLTEDHNGNIWVGSWSNGGAYRSDGNPCSRNSCRHDLQKTQDLAAHQQEMAQPITGFTRQDGLCDVMIACFFEDSNGLLWIGTRDGGVCRYDGKSFTNFSEKEGLCNDNISCISEDKTGNFWFGSTVKSGYKPGGICRYDGKVFTAFTAKEGLENNDIFCCVVDKSGNLWFGGRYGRLFRYDGKSFTDFSSDVHPQ